ncbi:transposase [Nannocystis punicea]|uniref:Transposase n=1 Tax=Nannocystis punicea TaxID=2995304 RepID=A0ABY7HKH9_9BACT|nr:transposase [Nannocystis poenicansa]WAS99535.1 transposase [Nannocystis poenicansa]
MQALEHARPALPVRPGKIERIEYEYVRHGTLCLTANLEIATGHIVSPTIGPRRTEQDFVDHIARTVDGDPDARWIFVLDNLNTHNSEALVRFVASHCGLDVPLGAKGESGVLRSMETRAAFLSDPSHRIRFVYTPKHCSWLNQIEIWFSILVRRLLRRASFSSLEALRERLVEFIAFFNRCMAKPFRWTYKGKVLAA